MYFSLTTDSPAVSNISHSDITTTAVKITWVVPAGTFSHYMLYWRNPSTDLNISIANPEAASYLIESLTSGVTYNVSLYTVNEDNEESLSAPSITVTISK